MRKSSTHTIAIVGTFATTTPVAQAYNSKDCGDDFVHWSGDSPLTTLHMAAFQAGGKPKSYSLLEFGMHLAWAQTSILKWGPQSSNDWTKRTDRYNSRIAETVLTWNGTTCHLTNMGTWFNTRYSFDVCTDCPSGTYDVRTVAIHEFGHWLVLEHVSWWRVWDYDCAMWENHGSDRTLCGHDIDGIVEIYGAD